MTIEERQKIATALSTAADWLRVQEMKGGPGSGNFGHEGRPGEVGGSGEGGGGGSSGDGRSGGGDGSGTSEDYSARNPHSISSHKTAEQRAAEFRKLPDDAYVIVFHATDDVTADAILKNGTSPETKPITRLDDSRFSPGHGLSTGLSVGTDPVSVSGYGKRILAIRVKKSNIKAPPEQMQFGKHVDPAKALSVSDAIIDVSITPSSFTDVTSAGRYVTGYEAMNYSSRQEMKASRRDPVEPGVIHKTRFDKQLSVLLSQHFDQQRAAIEQYLGMGGRLPIPEHLLRDDELTADLTRTLMAAALDGISQVTDEIGIGFDDTLTNQEAAVWARQHAGEMIDKVDATSLDAVQSAITTFADTPGFTLADVMARLPYDTARAERIAVTEITRAYAEANQLVGQQLGIEFAGVPVVKIWYTNNDDKVCPICAPLNGKEVGIADEFADSISNPPAHPNCRCWTTTSTRIG